MGFALPGEARAAAVAVDFELVPSSTSTAGFKGVYKRNGKYLAKVWEDGKQRHLGTFATPCLLYTSPSPRD